MAWLGLPGYHPTQIQFRPPPAGKIALLLTGLVAIYLFGAGLASPTELNGIGPLLLLGICLFAAAEFVRHNALMVVSPMFGLFLVCAVYYGFGALLFEFGNPSSVLYVHRHYEIDDTTLFRTNLLNALGLATITLTFFVGMKLFPLRPTWTGPVFDRQRLDRFILICLAIGAPVRFLVVPLNNSMTLGFFLPSQILTLNYLVIFALMLMIWARLSGERKWDWLLFPLLGWEILVQASSGAKIAVILLMLPIFLGVYMARPRFTMLVRGALIGAVVWPILVTTVDAVRTAARAGQASGLGGRVVATLSAFDPEGTEVVVGDEDVQKWWTRLCYSASQGFCFDAYDAGRPGNTFELWFWAFVPRALVPSKPEMTVGQMFNIEVTGNPNSKTAPGAFAEAYWNGGWPMVVGACIFVGALFVWLTHVSVATFLLGDFRWLPLAWSGIVMGLRIDDFFVATFASWSIGLFNSVILVLIFPRRRQATAAPRGVPAT